MESNYRFHGGQDQQLMGPPNMATSPYQSYRPGGTTPNMASPHQRLSPMTPVTSRIPASPLVQHMRQPNSRSIQSSPNLLHLASPQSALGRSAYSMSPPLSVSDTARTPRSLPTSNTRRLPNARITRDTIESSYVSFILHANPTIPSSTDTSELRKALKLIPKSDGKTFDLFNLWGLIRRLDGGELKTWIQLALELGVEPPVAERNQSAQKIQQYVVRLKRWMHAMHVDAFFDYCLGKRHIYFTQIPTAAPIETPEPRDGVPPEEDLAIRALIPGWKPKRGRKKASEKEDSEAEERPHKRPQIEISPAMLEYQGLEGPSMFPQGAMTWSAFPGDPEAQDPWGNAGLAITTAAAPQNQMANSTGLADPRWHRALSPSAYPQSAIEPSYSIEDAFDMPEPRSAIAPNTSAKTARTRRRNGAAISSAWNPSGSSSAGKSRGRPAANRPSQEPSFPTQRIQTSRPPSRPSSVATSTRSFQIHAPMPQPGRPAKLSLQVPQHQGGPIRLATPPTVMLNVPATVVSTDQDGRASADFYRVSEGVATFLDHGPIHQEHTADAFDISIDDVAHAFAARILHGKLIGRQGSLSLEEATLISNKAIEQLRRDWPDELSEEAYAVRCATALGVSSDLGTGSGAASIINVKSMPQPLHLFSRNRGRGMSASTSTATARGRDGTVEYVLSFDIVYGSGISSNVQIHNIFIPLHVNDESFEREINVLRAAISSGKSQRDNMLAHSVGEAGTGDVDDDGEEKSWKERYMELQREMKRKDELLKKMRRRVFEVVMAGDS